MGVAGHLDLLPQAYAWRLKRREQIRDITREQEAAASRDENR